MKTGGFSLLKVGTVLLPSTLVMTRETIKGILFLLAGVEWFWTGSVWLSIVICMGHWLMDKPSTYTAEGEIMKIALFMLTLVEWIFTGTAWFSIVVLIGYWLSGDD